MALFTEYFNHKHSVDYMHLQYHMYHDTDLLEVQYSMYTTLQNILPIQITVFNDILGTFSLVIVNPLRISII